MKKADVKEGARVLIPVQTWKEVTIVRQDGPIRTIVRQEDGREVRVPTRILSAL